MHTLPPLAPTPLAHAPGALHRRATCCRMLCCCALQDFKNASATIFPWMSQPLANELMFMPKCAEQTEGQVAAV